MPHSETSTNEFSYAQAAPQEPIAIVGMGCRLPGGVNGPSSLWELLEKKRSGQCRVPANKFNVDAFYHPDNKRPGSLHADGGYFIEEDLRNFDPTFFGIGAQEAAEIDPQQRKLLEVVYECLESSGTTLEDISNTDTACYAGCFTSDYSKMAGEELDSFSAYHATGTGVTLLSNRVSYVFNLKGPSMTLDTACSSAMYAFHLACKAIKAGDCEQALVCGTNLVLNLEQHISTAKLGILSPTSTCHTFDAKADGYGRADGVGSLLLKPLSKALADGNPIRAIVRGTAFNANGKTGGITAPSVDGQEAVIRQAYKDAGLTDAYHETTFFECHGTGTPVGDPIEVDAIGRVFAKGRSQSSPLLIGSIKTNLGHSEAASGISSIIKAVLSLEHGVIPGTVGYETPNPKIDFYDNRIKVVANTTPYPTLANGVRRASINSFGYGGANAHTILESYVPTTGSHGYSNGWHDEPVLVNGNNAANQHQYSKKLNGAHKSTSSGQRKSYLLCFSANSEPSLEGAINNHLQVVDKYSVADLARTLAVRRTRFSHRAYAVAGGSSGITASVRGKKKRTTPTAAFVFTGQGAQWPQMGYELMQQFPTFRQTIRQLDDALQALPDAPAWTIEAALSEPAKTSKVQTVALSQPLCTAIQIAMVALLKSWNITPVATVGHSSGEIAAAFAAGLLSSSEAIVAAFYRGLEVSKQRHNGAMLAVAVSPAQAQAYIDEKPHRNITIACVNSSQSVTLSGDADHIGELQKELVDKEVLARLLKTDGNAYHSSFMKPVGDSYEEKLTNASTNKGSSFDGETKPRMFSSVTGEIVENATLPVDYWRRNLESRVIFDVALAKLVAETPEVNWIVEIGPHSALAGPINQILSDADKAGAVSYAPAMVRNKDATETILEVAGKLFLEAYPVDLKAVNSNGEETTTTPIKDLPPYTWNYEKMYWKEPRTSIESRNPKFPRHDILGRRDPSASSSKRIVWRNFLRSKDLPWLDHHKMAGQVYFPGACYIAATVEALQQLVQENEDLKQAGITSYSLKDINIKETLLVPNTNDGIETVFYLQPMVLSRKNNSDKFFEVAFCSLSGGEWFENFTATGVISSDDYAKPAPLRNRRLKQRGLARLWYELFDRNDMTYGPTFRTLNEIHTNPGTEQAVGKVKLTSTDEIMPHQSRYMVHPTSIDGCFQLLLIAAHAGQVQKLQRRLIPQEIEEATFYVTSHPNTGLGTADAFGRTVAGKAFGTTNLYNSRGECAMSIRETKFASFDVQKVFHTDRYPYMRTVWKPMIDYLNYDTMQDLYPSGAQKEWDDFDYEKVRENFLDVNRFSVVALALAVNEFRLDDGTYKPPSGTPHLSHYVEFLLEKCAAFKRGEIDYATDLSQLSLLDLSNQYQILKEKASKTVEGILIDKVYKALALILTGRASLLDVALEDNLLSRVYGEGQAARAANIQLSRVMDLLGHRNPDLDILEVGAGTGGTTRTVLKALSGKSRMKRYRTYTFTDVTTGFLAGAKEEFAEYRDIIYTTFDANRAPSVQGITKKYDVVVAANAIHVTPNVVETLKNIRGLLNPGGKLVLLETTNNNIGVSFMLGPIREWWIGRHEGRVMSPFQTLEKWQECLQTAGYNGLDFVLKDYPGAAHITSILVSSVDDGVVKDMPLVAQPSLPDLYIAYRPGVTRPELCQAVANSVSHRSNPILVPCDQALELPNKARVISLIEAGQPFFTNVDASTWDGVKKIVSQSSTILWVTTGAYIKGLRPEYGVALGWARSIMVEHPSVRVWTLDLEDENAASDVAGIRITDLEEKLWLENGSADVDFEFCESNGVIHISRIYEDAPINKRFVETYTAGGNASGPISTYENMKFTLEKTGVMDSSFFLPVELQKDLASNEVEIEAKAWGLANKGVLSMMGKFDSDNYCYEATGVVKRVGSSVSSIQPGTPVMCFYEGDFSTIIRVNEYQCYPFQEEDGFEAMCSIPSTFLAAVHGVFNVGRVQEGESVLIHSAAGGLGLALVQLSKYVGAKIFATVGSEKKKAYLTETWGIPESQIFLRSNFKEPLMTATKGEGVDVVFNTLNGEAFYDSWTSVATFGRFIELGFGDVYANAKLELGAFAKNVSLLALNLSVILQHKPKMIRMLFEQTMKLFREGAIKPLEPLNILKVSEFSDAVRLFMNGSRLGKVVVSNNDPQAVVKYRSMLSKPHFPSDAGYLIIGGLGGLGRSIALWMKRFGARHFVFLSRSGGARPAEKEAVAEIQENTGEGGARVYLAKGDVTKKEDIEKAVNKCPVPIRGVINAAMVLRDALFVEMSTSEFNDVMRPKVVGAINLHEIFLNTELDFFIQCSSIASLTGTATQSNYCAANSFLDAFSRHRRALGLPATSIDVGMIGEVGYAATTPIVVDAILRIGLHVIYEYEFHDMLDSVIFHGHHPSPEPVHDPFANAVLVTGLEPHRLREFWAMGFGGGNFWKVDRRFRAIIAATEDATTDSSAQGSASTEKSGSIAARVAALEDKKDVLPLLQEAICHRISRLLLIDAEDIDVAHAPLEYGIDSMIGAELRHWFFSALNTDLPFSVILSPRTTITGLAEKAMESLAAAA